MFTLKYAARNLWRNRRWSLFALLSIAAGVATIVALRSLGLAIGDSLTSNLRASNHGDITIAADGDSGFVFGGGPPGSGASDDAEGGFPAETLALLDEWAQARGGDTLAWHSSFGLQIAVPGSSSAGRPQFITSIFMEPQVWPLSHEVVALDPSGVPLAALFQGGNELVISQNLAESGDIGVGDAVRLSGTEEEFTVRGIVSSEYESGLRNLFAAFFGFAYLDIASAPALSLGGVPNRLSIILPPGEAPQTEEEAERLEEELRQLAGRGISINTLPELRAENQTIADLTGQFIVIMGLGAMLIGGVGIANTMLVLVRRRAEEIASLKTFGLKGRQVAALFMSEALLLGLAGSATGAGLGILLSRFATRYGETLIQQRLDWRPQPDALLFGLVIGLIVSAVFGVLPVLTAVRVRPGILLRPNEQPLPRTGLLHSLLALALVVLALGLIAGQILDSMAAGLIGTAATLLILGLLLGLLWLLVWLIGRLPAPGSVDLRLALRNLRSGRARTATTLLALSAGMFALSSIAFFGAGARQLLQFALSENLGGNVIIFSPLPAALSQPLIDNRLDSLDGLRSRTRLLNYRSEIVAIDGQPVAAEEVIARARELRQELRAASRVGDIERTSRLGRELAQLPDYILDISVRDTTGENLGGSGGLLSGRGLTRADIGQPLLLLSDEELREIGARADSVLRLRVAGREYDFRIVGVQPSSTAFAIGTAGEAIAPPGVFEESGDPAFQFTLAEIEAQHLDEGLLSLSALPLVFAIDISFIDGLIGRFIDQFSALPILVGLLSLGAAAVILANTVALATLERRRQIGILKAVGLKGRRVLGIMLLENTLISLLGSLLGVGLSALGVAIMSRLGVEATILIPDDARPVALALVIAAVFIGALATVLSAQVAINERALNVLRYE